jgi:hypothetical protein
VIWPRLTIAARVEANVTGGFLFRFLLVEPLDVLGGVGVVVEVPGPETPAPPVAPPAENDSASALGAGVTAGPFRYGSLRMLTRP